MDSRRLDAVEEDIGLVLQRTAELVKLHSKCRNEVATMVATVGALSRNQDETNTLLSDVRAMISKEAIQQLYTRVSNNIQVELGTLQEQLREELHRSQAGLASNFVTLDRIDQLKTELLAMNQFEGLKDEAERTRYFVSARLDEFGQVVPRVEEVVEQFPLLKENLNQNVNLLTKQLATFELGQEEKIKELERSLKESGEFYSSGVNTLRNQLSKLEKEVESVNALRGQLSKLEEGASQISALQAQISGLGYLPIQVTTLQEQLGGIPLQIATLREKISNTEDLSSQMSVLREQVKVLPAQIITLQAQLENLEKEAQLSPLPSKIKEFEEQTATKLASLEEQLTTLPSKLSTLEEQLSSLRVPALEEKLSALAPGLQTLQSQVNGIDSKLASKLTSLEDQVITLSQENRELVTKLQTLQNIAENLVTNPSGHLLTKAEYSKDRRVFEETAPNTFISRAEFEAMRTIIATKNDLANFEKLKEEQEILRHSIPSRERLNLLQAELEALRETLTTLEERKPVAGPEHLTLDPFKYLKMADCHFLISNGFKLTQPETTFSLKGITPPSEAITVSGGSNYISILHPDGQLVFKRGGEKEIEVRRFMIWW